MTTKEAKGMKFLKELTPDDMPFAGEVYERLKDYLIVKRVSDESRYEKYKEIIFTMQISDFEDSTIKLRVKIRKDESELDIYNVINGEWVNILEDNTIFRKYYARSHFRNDRKWSKYIQQSGIAGDKKYINNNSRSLWTNMIVSLHISESLSFYRDPFYLYRLFTFRGFNQENLDWIYSYNNPVHRMRSSLRSNIFKDLSFIDCDSYNTVSKEASLYTKNDIDNYIKELSIELIGAKNSAINYNIMKIKKDINSRKLLPLIAEINVNKLFFGAVFQRYFQIFDNYNKLKYTLPALLERLSDVVYFIDDYEEYIDGILFDINTDCKGLYYEKDKYYFGRNMPIREITDNKGQIYTVFQYGGTWSLYRSGMSPESMTEIMKGMNTAFDNISRSGRDAIPEEFVLKKIEGKDLYRLVGMLDGNDKIIKFNNPLHLMELFRIDYIIDIEDSLSRNIGDYEKRGRIENVIEYYH